MLIDVECPRCNGMGECHTATPSQRARYVRHDDLSPDDYAEQCPKCAGSGTVDYDPEDECARAAIAAMQEGRND